MITPDNKGDYTGKQSAHRVLCGDWVGVRVRQCGEPMPRPYLSSRGKEMRITPLKSQCIGNKFSYFVEWARRVARDVAQREYAGACVDRGMWRVTLAEGRPVRHRCRCRRSLAPTADDRGGPLSARSRQSFRRGRRRRPTASPGPRSGSAPARHAAAAAAAPAPCRASAA